LALWKRSTKRGNHKKVPNHVPLLWRGNEECFNFSLRSEDKNKIKSNEKG